MPTNEKHRALLRAAAERDDALLPEPERLVGAARRRMSGKFLALAVAETVSVVSGQPQWFQEAGGRATGLRLTTAGRMAVSEATAPEADAAEDQMAEPPSPGHVPRAGSKAALLLEMLNHEDGATLDALSKALGWQPHTVRAALTRLRQGGTPVVRTERENGSSIFRIAAPSSGRQAALSGDAAILRRGRA